MPKQRIRLLILLLSLPLCQVTHAGGNALADRYSDQRKLYLQFDELLRAGETAKVSAARSGLDGYPLQKHLDYLLLRKQIEASEDPAGFLPQVVEFADDKRLHRRLLGVVKNRSVELTLWRDYAKAAVVENAPVHPCDDLLAGLINEAGSKEDKARQFTNSSRDLWSDVGRHTKSCDEAFSMLLDAVPDVPTRALWQRVVALLKRGQLDSIEELLKYFNQRDLKVVRAWMEGYSQPHKALQSEAMRGDSVHHQKVASFFLSRWAREDLLAASQFWRTQGQVFGFNAQSVEKKLSEFAVLSAKRDMPEATKLLNDAADTRAVRFWRVRMALQEKNWAHCIATLDALSKDEQAEPRWQYWRARCLEAQGFQAASERIYREVSRHFGYHGFLAADKVAREYQIESSAFLVDDSALKQLRASPEIAKAVEYFLVGLPWEGRRVWNAEMKKSSSRASYRAAAQLAESVGWYDRALDSAATSGDSEVLSLMFPPAYKDAVLSESRRFNVPAEFVYGVMRRESRFISDIKSPAGAIGLMQLMPRTAAQMAEQLGIKAPKWRLIDSDLNIKLGVKYLDYVTGRFDSNLALAAAAYNAGPSRVKKWLAQRPVATDLWVETIPFDETRAYVQSVLFNTVVSEWVINDGSVTRLRERMPELPVPQLVVNESG